MTRMKGITQGGSLIARLAFFFSRCLYGKVLQPLRVWALDDRPLQAGDRVTQYRKDFFRRYSQVLQVEKVVPSRSLHVLDLSPGAVRINATVSISVEEAIVREATWIEEAIFDSLGKSRVMHWLDLSVVNPVLQLVADYKTNKAFRRLQAILEQPHAPVLS